MRSGRLLPQCVGGRIVGWSRSPRSAPAGISPPAVEVRPTSRSRASPRAWRPRPRLRPDACAAPMPAPRREPRSERNAAAVLPPAVFAAALLASSRRPRSRSVMRTLPFASARALVRGAFSAPARAAVSVAERVSNAPAIIDRPQDTDRPVERGLALALLARDPDDEIGPDDRA